MSWTISVRPSLKAEIERIAEEENNTPSRVLERLLRRALALQTVLVVDDTSDGA